jgi:hypothetical protein
MILPTRQPMPTLEIVDVAIRLHGEQAEVGVGKKQTWFGEIREEELSQSWAFDVSWT